MFKGVFEPLVVISIMLGSTFGFLSGFSELRRPWLAFAISALAFVIFLLTAQYIETLLRFMFFVIYISFAIVFVLIQSVRNLLRLKPELSAWWKSASKIVGIITVCCFLHAVLDAVPTYYCRSAKKVFTPMEVCVELFDQALREGYLLLGPGEKSARDYYNNHPGFCRHEHRDFSGSPGATNSWRLGGLYEFLFLDQTIFVELKYQTTPFGTEYWYYGPNPRDGIAYWLDNCSQVLRVDKLM
jgi:hypothetical protein